MSLAERADSVAALLADRDGCGAVSEAQVLQRETIAAVNAGRIPPALQEETLAEVTELAESIPCGGASPTPTGAEARRLAERLRALGG